MFDERMTTNMMDTGKQEAAARCATVVLVLGCGG
jgi:hypothetical protein